MRELFTAKKRFSNFMVLILIFLFIVESAMAAPSQYGSVKKSDALLSNTSTNKSEQVQSVTNLGVVEQGSLQSNKLFDQKANMLNLLGQPIQVHVLGDVVAPGVIDTTLSTRASELIQMAQPKRNNVRLFQVRHENEKTKYYDLYQYYFFGNLKHNPYVKDNDVVFVPEERGAIRIEGPVKRTGVFEIGWEKNLYQIIQLAGGFTRALSKENPLKIIRYSETGKKQLLEVSYKTDALRQFRIRNGDIIIVPDVLNANKRFDYSIETLPGENLVYPTSVADVFVIGSVLNPGPYPYKSQLTVKDYVGFAGAQSNAHLSNVKILRNGKKKGKRLDAQVDAGDVIIVREKNTDQFVKYLGIASTILSVTLSTIVIRRYMQD